jgi:SAM-dependent methyltransferase
MPVDEQPFTRRRLPVRRPHALLYARAMRQALGDGEDPQGVWRTAMLAMDFRREIVDAYVWEQFGFVVQDGPFKGMKYVEKTAGSSLSPKLLGCYEQELQPYIARTDRYRRFIDIGCAEGYYAVGVKRLNPDIEVFAFDRSEDARQLCRELQQLNGISAGFEIGGECAPETLGELAEPGSLVMIDIEGAEVGLLRQAPKECLASCDLIVETHQNNGGTLGAVVAELERTHEVTVVPQQPRDWTSVPALQPLGQLDRFLAQWEGRGPEPWVVATPRS